MITMRVLMATVLLCCAAEVARADFIIEPVTPPQEKVLSGTLSWENVKRPDGSTVKGRLLLNTGDRQIPMPVTSGSNVRSSKPGEAIDASAYVGKQVKVTAKVVDNVKRKTTTTVVSVIRIEEQDASTAEAKTEGTRPSAETKTR